MTLPIKYPMRICQQVLDMGDAGVETLETVVGCTLTDAFTLLSGRGVVSPIVPRAKAMPPSPCVERLEGAETAR
jgi:hypothetical protein